MTLRMASPRLLELAFANHKKKLELAEDKLKDTNNRNERTKLEAEEIELLAKTGFGSRTATFSCSG